MSSKLNRLLEDVARRSPATTNESKSQQEDKTMGTHMFSDRMGKVEVADAPFTRNQREDFGWDVDGRRIQCKRAWGLRQQLIDISGLIGETTNGTVTNQMIALGVGSNTLVNAILNERELTQEQVDQLMDLQDRAREKISHLRDGGKWEDFRMREHRTKSTGYRRLDKPKAVDGEGANVQEATQIYAERKEGGPVDADEYAAAKLLKERWFRQAGQDALMGRESVATRLLKALIEIYPEE